MDKWNTATQCDKVGNLKRTFCYWQTVEKETSDPLTSTLSGTHSLSSHKALTALNDNVCTNRNVFGNIFQSNMSCHMNTLHIDGSTGWCGLWNTVPGQHLTETCSRRRMGVIHLSYYNVSETSQGSSCQRTNTPFHQTWVAQRRRRRQTPRGTSPWDASM